MGYRPSLRETSRKILRGVEGSGGGSSRVCRLSSPIWEETDQPGEGRCCDGSGEAPATERRLLPARPGQRTQTQECVQVAACLLKHTHTKILIRE